MSKQAEHIYSLYLAAVGGTFVEAQSSDPTNESISDRSLDRKNYNQRLESFDCQ